MPAPRRNDPRRRNGPHIAWPLKALAVLMVGLAAYAAFDAATGEDAAEEKSATGIERSDSRKVGPADAGWTFTAFPASHEIRYRVNVTDAITSETVLAVSPFSSRSQATGRARTPGGPRPVDERESGFGTLATRTSAGQVTVLQVPPFVGAPRPAAALLEAEGFGLVVRREVREVAGRRCQVWRTGDELAATTFLPPNDRDYIDLCVDATGLVLEEWQVSKGKAVRQRVALRVQEGGVTDADVRTLPQEVTVPIDRGGGSVRETEPTAQPVGPFLEIPTPPAGFTHRGRFSVVPPTSALTESDDRRGRVTASVTDVYESGADAIIVERGGVLDLSDPWLPDDRLPDVDLGPAIGTGEFVPGTFGGEVRALLGSGRYLRIYGSASLVTLADLARSLTKVENGTGIEFRG